MKRLLIVPLLLIVVACQSLNIPTLDTARKRLAAAEVSFTAVVTTLTEMRNDGVIEGGSTLEGKITQGIVATDAALDTAQAAVRDNDAVSADEWVDIALSGISQLELFKKEAQ